MEIFGIGAVSQLFAQGIRLKIPGLRQPEHFQGSGAAAQRAFRHPLQDAIIVIPVVMGEEIVELGTCRQLLESRAAIACTFAKMRVDKLLLLGSGKHEDLMGFSGYGQADGIACFARDCVSAAGWRGSHKNAAAFLWEPRWGISAGSISAVGEPQPCMFFVGNPPIYDLTCDRLQMVG